MNPGGRSGTVRNMSELIRSQHSSTSSYKTNQNINKILHCKCKVVKLVKEQMERAETNVSQELKDCLNRSLSRTLWRKRYYILSLIIVFLLMWLMLVYGAMIGAALCGGRVRNSGCTNCHADFMQSAAWTKHAVSVY